MTALQRAPSAVVARKNGETSTLTDQLKALASTLVPGDDGRGATEAVAAGVDWTDWDLIEEGVDVEGLLRRPAGPLNWREMDDAAREHHRRLYAKSTKRKGTKGGTPLLDGAGKRPARN